MRVFILRQDCDRYRCFHVERGTPDPFEDLRGASPNRLADRWTPPAVYLANSKLKVGDFLNARDHYLVTNQRATRALMPILQRAGELLPLPYDGQMYTVLNVTEYADCLDHLRTSWVTGPSGYRIMAEDYVFAPDRLPGSVVFKTPDLRGQEIFVVEGMRKPGEEFREIVRRERLKGLLFKEVWSSDVPSERSG